MIILRSIIIASLLTWPNLPLLLLYPIKTILSSCSGGSSIGASNGEEEGDDDNDDNDKDDDKDEENPSTKPLPPGNPPCCSVVYLYAYT
jgi:hypothetical protein